MSVLSQFGGSPIKQIQRGTVVISGNTTTASVSILPVDTSKTVLNFLGGSVTITDSVLGLPRVRLASSTLVVADRGGSPSFASSVASFEVIEFY